MSGSTRVFVRLFDGAARRETDDEVVALPPAPLAWSAVITAMAATVKSGAASPDVTRARLFLLPTEADGIAAELNARALRFGVRENDRFVLCLNGEDYQQPKASDVAEAVKVEAPTSAFATAVASNGAPGGTISGAGPPGGSIGLSSGRKGNKRYRSISGKMAAIKALGDKGLISSEDRGHLKDLLLNNDSPQLQEALDKYNSTGDFQAVKDLLVQEMQNPSAKRNTSDWLSESLVNDITLSFNDTPTAQSSANTASRTFSSTMMPANSESLTAPSSSPFSYQSSSLHQSSTAQLSQNTNGYSQSATIQMSYSANLPSASTMPQSSGAHISPTVARPPMLTTPRSFVPALAQPTVMPDPFNHPQMSPTNVYAASAAQINMPLRDRSGFMKRAYEASPVNGGMNGLMVPVGATAAVSNMSYGMQQQQQQYQMSQGYAGMTTGYPNGGMGQNPYSQQMAAGSMYSMNGMYNPYQQQGYSTVPTSYPYGTLMLDGSAVPGYDFYSAGYGYGKAQLRVGGKWTSTPPMPSYPPPCSKEEKKEKIARWLKKRENRNWSNKPSYPVRHSIAKARKRGEDGRFITKARLAEMAKEEEAAAAAAAESGGVELRHDGDAALGLDHQGLSMPSAMPQPTPVV